MRTLLMGAVVGAWLLANPVCAAKQPAGAAREERATERGPAMGQAVRERPDAHDAQLPRNQDLTGDLSQPEGPPAAQPERQAAPGAQPAVAPSEPAVRSEPPRSPGGTPPVRDDATASARTIVLDRKSDAPR